MIIVVGSINLDLVGRVERLPAPGETVRGSSFATSPGGKGANQALAARRAGAPVAMIGAVGDDTQSREALALLERDGVDLSGVARVEGTSTGVALILVDDGRGENAIAVIAGANGCVESEKVTAHPIGEDDALLLQMEIPAAANHAALDHARKAGALSLFNAAPFDEDAVGLARKADVTIVNETEFDLLAAALGLEGADRAARMAAFPSATGRSLVVTLGAEGAVAVTRNRRFDVAAPEIDPVDTVGAGDTFCGYLAAAFAEGLDWPLALDLAVRAGAAACLKTGAQPAIPFRESV
ncbi:ribokinase [Oricola thermophila]|uniref:Ribokinase n=1 Tax=Oricola thermophila TaxID=2742145 RepID=A0A6N1VK50_9HYPH|nr:ribokinase [Oricola thermophila]QKV19579.1 ribokinase [Oricola thermophila]